MTDEIKRNILLNPGPVTTTKAVKQAMLVPDICHREAEFTQVLRSIRDDLLKIVHAGENYTSVLFTASGTGAIEACISSVVTPGKKIAIINNGSYGQRMIDIAKRFQIPVVEIPYGFDEPLQPEQIAALLVSDDDIEYLAMVHHETSTGLLNPLREIGEVCHQNNCGFIVDAMSSFGGIDIDVNRDHIDFVISSSNKCLHGMPGLSFVICQKDRLFAAKNKARGYYFDLYQQYKSLEKSGQMSFTPAVQVAYAFRKALDEFFQETAAGRRKRYHDNYDLLIGGLQKLGFKLITPQARQSRLLATIAFPDDGNDYDFDDMHDYLFAKGFTIYPKKLPIPNTFRIACLGDLNQQDIQHFLEVVFAYMCLSNKSLLPTA